jgi:hypothetical protein
MKKLYTSMLALAACTAPLFAQAQAQRLAAPGEGHTPRACGTMEVLAAQLAADPGQAQRMAAIEAHARRVQADRSLQRGQTTLAATGPVIIPVVVHVLYNTAAQNISDAQVQSQIDVLNEDFRKLNADYTNTPPLYAGLVADANVQFVLAKRTPTGAATNGIIHKQTKTSSWSANDAVKNSKRGGDDAWDATKYLNLWACNLGQGLLGYAQFPGGSASTDGVVILYSAFGSRAKYPAGTYTSTYDLGRTATHEVGHWLNLRHIWGDASCGNDQVSDTPTQQTSNYGCPAFPHVTCSNQGDMSMNYMDYVDDKCMYMFSGGQAARMNALFATGGARASLLTSTGGTAPRLMASAMPAFYPNPTTDQLTLNLPDGARASQYTVHVYDLRGREMPQARYTNEGQVQVSDLPKGMYLISIGTGNEVVRQHFEKQ